MNPTAIPEPTTQPTKTIPPNLDSDLTEAFTLGIADVSLATQLDQPISQHDAVKLIKNVNDLYYGQDLSLFLKAMLSKYENSTKTTNRYFMAELIYYRHCENVENLNLSDPEKLMVTCDNVGWDETMTPDAGYTLKHLDGTIGETNGPQDITDNLFFTQHNDKYIFHEDYGNSYVAFYSILIFDRTSGIKVMPLDRDQNFNPRQTMTTEEAIRTALRYYRSFPKAPVEVAYDNVGTYNKDIIPDELLNKPTNLPDNSSHHLPAEWKGLLIYSMMHVTKGSLDRDTDKIITEKEIQLIHEAGFNYIGLSIGFSNLQEPFFHTGTVNLSQLEYVDQVLAWCMKYDIHMEIRAYQPSGATDLSNLTNFFVSENLKNQIFTDTALRDEFARFWQMLARRYAAIPNKYLSFNLVAEPNPASEDQYYETFKPIVEAIRKESPDRTLIMDIHSNNLTGEKIASLGVALSSHMYEPPEFTALFSNPDFNYSDDYLSSVKWPYTDQNGKVWSIKAMMNAGLFGDTSSNAMTMEKIKAVAEKAGVGFMVGEWGIFGTPGGQMLTVSYPRKTIYGFDKDMINTLDEMGVGWCMGNGYFGEYGIVAPYPAMKGVNYVPLQGTNLYEDPDMLAFYQGMLK
jgi:hypothetical protein